MTIFEIKGNKDSAARSVGVQILDPAFLSNRLVPEDWPQSRASSQATKCWTATGSACKGRTLRRPYTCSKIRGGLICSSGRALPRVNCLDLGVHIIILFSSMQLFQISFRRTKLPTNVRRWSSRSPPAMTAPPRVATATNSSNSRARST